MNVADRERAIKIVGEWLDSNLGVREELFGVDEGIVEALIDAELFTPADRLRAFALDCVAHGDMTPTAARMINRILSSDDDTNVETDERGASHEQ